MTMQTLTYQVSFNTPAFLGNAEQQAQWRTPPFKALLRQWWRVVKAPDVGYDHHALLRLENELFGSAGASDADSTGGGRSKVQLRLSSWDAGGLTSVPTGEMVSHTEVPGGKVGANLYLGYGPIGGQTRSAIKPGSSAPIALKLRCPIEHGADLRKAMQLVAWFGTLGSRSRNGWGSLHLEAPSGEQSVLGFSDLANANFLMETSPLLSLTDCLSRDWRAALGTDDTAPLVWRLFQLGPRNQDGKLPLEPFVKWEDAMRELARIKIAVRTSEFFSFHKHGGGKEGHPQPLPRHILAYPAGSKHKVDASGWKDQGRMANQVVFKVHRWKTGFTATIAHFPTTTPLHMAHKLHLPDARLVWQEVHHLLDVERSKGLLRIKGVQA
ncbi:hypothetical protein [Rhodoferax antarcticus]|uniref:CRISPR type III-associated protein domain-containing protein n=1 Tax=Rhodoferax antarcticus ANT.BR TaxID=1111071 RepID=A0A1Q8YEN6_9BURK|nr:hypothetical protein [Rhodoferax antarcticus]APW46299.1 hypothetical protein RA876_07820 [Rhodoferax antarcticus]OLP06511.1 hypothetical protein BLL52_2747 [Rhodoferax antarcticus ANT.BR]